MNLIEKIDTRSTKVGVIGLEYVGLSLAIELINAGYKLSGNILKNIKSDHILRLGQI
jgi:UDP-N-acetyl-D-mannosaminuronate dehydrogenase